MIAQGNAISHGARAIEYSIDKDKARLVKVNDLPENIEPLAMWSRMMQHQHQCMKDRYNPKPITLNALRFEISPAKEESAGWTMTDWQNLLDVHFFIKEFSTDIRIRNQPVIPVSLQCPFGNIESQAHILRIQSLVRCYGGYFLLKVHHLHGQHT